MLTINRLPGNRGSFTAKTEKRTKMFVYAVKGSDADLQTYSDAKSAEGFDAVIDPEYGHLYFTAINHGKQAELNVTTEGKIFASNQGIREANELRSVVSDNKVDDLILAAMSKGEYAKVLVPSTDPNIGG